MRGFRGSEFGFRNWHAGAEEGKGRRPGFGFPVNKSIRMTVVILLAIAVAISIVFLVAANRTDRKVKTTTETITYVTCGHEASLDYDVHLIEDQIVYPEEWLPLGPDDEDQFFTNLVDHFEIRPSYEFTSDKPVQLSGRLAATAFLEAENIPPKVSPILLKAPKPSLSFQHQATLDYVVYLKPNTLYATPTLEPGLLYFHNIVDHLEVTASYTFDPTKPSESSGDYEVLAVIVAEGYWQKSQTIVPITSFDAGGGSETRVVKTFNIDPAVFRELADSVNKELGIAPRTVDMLLQFNVNMRARNADGVTPSALHPFMKIPLSGSTFTVDGSAVERGSGTIIPAGTGSERINFNIEGPGFSWDDTFRLDLTPYRDILDKISEQTGVSVKNPQLRVVFAVDANVQSEYGSISPERMAPQMIIPLTGTTFAIGGPIMAERSTPITETVQHTEETVSHKGTGGQLAALVIFCVLFVGFVAGTRSKPPEVIDPVGREARSIGRKYGDRIVESARHGPLPGEKTITVDSMDAIDRIAEQLMRPIIHQPPASEDSRHLYYVLDGPTRYEFVLSRETPSIKESPDEHQTGDDEKA